MILPRFSTNGNSLLFMSADYSCTLNIKDIWPFEPASQYGQECSELH